MAAHHFRPVRLPEATIVRAIAAFAVLLAFASRARAADPDLILQLKMNETGGTTATDASGQDNNGTVVTGGSAAQWVTGHHGGVLACEGLTAARARYVRITWSSSLAVTTALTAMAWVRIDGSDNDANIILGRGSLAADWHLYTDKKAKNLILKVDTGSSTKTLSVASPGGALSHGVWYHLAATYDGNHMRLYLNGAEIGNLAASGAVQLRVDPNLPLAVGATMLNGGTWDYALVGAFDDVKVWKRALSAAQIVQEMLKGGEVVRLRWTEQF
jgi:hypothetical protein